MRCVPLSPVLAPPRAGAQQGVRTAASHSWDGDTDDSDIDVRAPGVDTEGHTPRRGFTQLWHSRSVAHLSAAQPPPAAHLCASGCGSLDSPGARSSCCR